MILSMRHHALLLINTNRRSFCGRGKVRGVDEAHKRRILKILNPTWKSYNEEVATAVKKASNERRMIEGAALEKQLPNLLNPKHPKYNPEKAEEMKKLTRERILDAAAARAFDLGYYDNYDPERARREKQKVKVEAKKKRNHQSRMSHKIMNKIDSGRTNEIAVLVRPFVMWLKNQVKFDSMDSKNPPPSTQTQVEDPNRHPPTIRLRILDTMINLNDIFKSSQRTPLQRPFHVNKLRFDENIRRHSRTLVKDMEWLWIGRLLRNELRSPYLHGADYQTILNPTSANYNPEKAENLKRWRNWRIWKNLQEEKEGSDWNHFKKITLPPGMASVYLSANCNLGDKYKIDAFLYHMINPNRRILLPKVVGNDTERGRVDNMAKLFSYGVKVLHLRTNGIEPTDTNSRCQRFLKGIIEEDVRSGREGPQRRLLGAIRAAERQDGGTDANQGTKKGMESKYASSIVSLRLLYWLLREGHKPSPGLFGGVMLCLSLDGCSEAARRVVHEMEQYIESPDGKWDKGDMNFGWAHPDRIHYHYLLRSYAEAGDAEGALKALKDMRSRYLPNVHQFEAVIKACGRSRRPLDATMLFWTTMPMNDIKPRAKTFEEVITGCLWSVDGNDGNTLSELNAAYQVLEEMRKEGLEPSQKTYIAFLRVAIMLQDFDMATKFLKEWYEGLEIGKEPSKKLLSLYVKCGIIEHGNYLLEGGSWPPHSLREDVEGMLGKKKVKEGGRVDNRVDSTIRRQLLEDKVGQVERFLNYAESDTVQNNKYWKKEEEGEWEGKIWEEEEEIEGEIH
eukprot:CAMPEP_0118665636 /NCGR_PEP_ID=MMETSP0785-20121206/18731_1 /TAXON_ID=91992 /ORGANISM="Bolidomonas pacifica, Strain CCMP 1866" /LENGTH=790 /DNA_ID=CAMNT_0006559781 /DNA_START=131 /DNA_END=2500 /DNA_ORIENTATION=+